MQHINYKCLNYILCFNNNIAKMLSNLEKHEGWTGRIRSRYKGKFLQVFNYVLVADTDMINATVFTFFPTYFYMIRA